jgi:hypothetical protein
MPEAEKTSRRWERVATLKDGGQPSLKLYMLQSVQPEKNLIGETTVTVFSLDYPQRRINELLFYSTRVQWSNIIGGARQSKC